MKEDQDQDQEKVIMVRSYENAFAIYIGGQTLSDWISDSLTLGLVWFLFFVGIGEIPVIEDLYRFLWIHGWWFLNLIFAPLVMTVLMLALKEKGLSVWMWLFNLIKLQQEKKPRIPFDEPKNLYG